MADYFVSLTGSDMNDGLSVGFPFRTLNHAVLQLGAGDTLYVRSGTYNEVLNNVVPSGSSWGSKVRITNSPGEIVWIAPTSGVNVIYFDGDNSYIEFDGININGAGVTDASIFMDDRVGSLSDTTAHVPHHIRFQNAEIYHRDNLTGGNTNAAVLVAGNHHEFLNLLVHGIGGPMAFYVHGESHLIDSCNIYGVATAFIQVYDPRGIPYANVISNNLMHDLSVSNFNSATGVRAAAIIIYGAGNTLVYNNVIYRISYPYMSGGPTVAITVAGSGNRLWNNVIYGNSTDGINIDTRSTDTIVQNNIVYGNVSGSVPFAGAPDVTQNHNLLGVNPLFVDPVNADFRVQSGSPAIGTGISLSTFFTTDANGDTRTSWDIGAYLYTQALAGNLIEGITKNSADVPIPGCVVHLFKVTDLSFIGTTQSDSIGKYQFIVATNTQYFAVAYHPGTPDIAGVTDFNLVGVGSSSGTYTLSVLNGTGDGSYAPGTPVSIVADAPPSGQTFFQWTGPVISPTSASTTLVMPSNNVVVTATYVNISAGATYYVSTGGNDGNPGTQGSPFLTIAHGIGVMVAGDTLLVRGGTYNELLQDIFPSGTSWTNKVRIANFPGETVWLQHSASGGTSNAGGALVYMSQGQQYIEFDGINMSNILSQLGTAVFLENRSPGYGTAPDYIRFQNLEVINPDIPGGGSAAVNVGGTHHEFLNMKVHGTAGPYAFYVSGNNNLIDHCEIFDTSFSGLQIYHGGGYPLNNVVSNCYIHDITHSHFFGNPDPRLYGIIVLGSGHLIFNNVITNINYPYQSGNAGISLYVTDNVKLYNNTIYNNTTDGIVIGGPFTAGGPPVNTLADIKNNICYGNLGQQYVDGSTSLTNNQDHNLFGVNPQFVNALAGNLRLQASSPARNAGNNAVGITRDIVGNVRPTESTIDIGAYEYVP